VPEHETITNDLSRILLEGLRRWDELSAVRRRLPPPSTCLFPERDRERLEPMQLSWREWRLLELIDGLRPIDELIAREPGRELENAHALERLGQLGLVRTAPRSEYLPAVVLGPLVGRAEAEQFALLTMLDLDLLGWCDGRRALLQAAEELATGPDAIADSARRLVGNGAAAVLAGHEAWQRWLR
jgi:hypothetical protein